MSLRCSRCKAVYDEDLDAVWGREHKDHPGKPVGDGYGPDARCIRLVPNNGAPKAPDGTTALQVCGGMLIGSTAALTHDLRGDDVR